MSQQHIEGLRTIVERAQNDPPDGEGDGSLGEAEWLRLRDLVNAAYTWVSILLLGQRLQRAGLAFMSARTRHGPGGIRVDEIVCETVEDAARVDEWAAREGFPVEARVGTAEEVAELKKWQECV